jgi:hypothetical protein
VAFPLYEEQMFAFVKKCHKLADGVQWLVAEADRTGIPYQTLMNAKLREAMNLPDRVHELVREEIKKTG